MHIDYEIGTASYAHNISHRRTEGFLIHTHPTYELYYFVDGHASFLIDGREHALEPHTLLVFPPNLFHGIRVNDELTYDRYTIHFSPDSLPLERRSLLMQALPRAENAGGIPCIRQNMESSLFPLFRQLDLCAAQEETIRTRLAMILMEAVFASILLSAAPTQEPEPRAIPAAQEKILTHLNEHFTEPITLDDLAERFFLSKHHLNRLFRKATGTTVRDYLINKRVTYVQQLLINGIPATQAASLAGFGDYTSFYRAYVKRFGHSPSADRSSKRTLMNLNEALREQQVITPDAHKMKLEEKD